MLVTFLQCVDLLPCPVRPFHHPLPMWSRLKRLYPPPRAATGQSRARRRRGHLARRRRGGRDGILALGQRARVRLPPAAGGLSRSLSGDYLEASWFIRVPSDGGGLLAVDFDADALDPTTCRRRRCAACPVWTWPRCARAWRRRRAPRDGLREENGWPGAATPRTPRPDTAPARRPPTRELGAIQPLLQVREDIVGRLQSHRQTQQSF